MDHWPVSQYPSRPDIAVQEMPLTASSAMLVPPTDRTCGYDADVVRTLKDMGAVVIGITQMDEFGMGSLGKQPW
jgi:aspartyl-tRNA(Asn)/glutamyl-tRNA(Gln) amidotransferase subunit A